MLYCSVVWVEINIQNELNSRLQEGDSQANGYRVLDCT